MTLDTNDSESENSLHYIETIVPEARKQEKRD